MWALSSIMRKRSRLKSMRIMLPKRRAPTRSAGAAHSTSPPLPGED